MSGATLTPRRKRLLLLLGVGALLVVAGVLVSRAFQSNLMFYVTPAELAAGHPRAGEAMRIGGMVQPGSFQRSSSDALAVRFVLYEGDSRVPVSYRGVLPDLFAEGKGAIAQGRLDASGTFVANEILAKHDENYMPPKVNNPASNPATPGQGKSK